MSVITRVENSSIHVSDTSRNLGRLAASHIAKEIRSRLLTQPFVRVVFAAAPSQSEMLHALSCAENVNWRRVEAFHMDEYIGLTTGAMQLFSEWLKREFFSRVDLHKVNIIDPGIDPDRCADEYAALMVEAPIDIVCLGIGMNGHIAFNDPPANFAEPKDVRVVRLETASRVQQVREGLFPALEDVPTHAVTLSIPRLLRAEKLFCCVPGELKQAAVTRAFLGPIDPCCPASILREHPDCTVYLDIDSAVGLKEESQ
jgi:glucosamine-6-phosphate deaminase